MQSKNFHVLFLLLTLFCLKTVKSKKGFGPGSQEYGYIEVRKGAYMFYWLYYKNNVTQNVAANYPLVIWLQGGPGGSSTGFGNFLEIGTLDLKLNKRKSAWTKHVNVLYIDNPVGTGFSYVKSKKLFVKNNHEIAVDLVTFIKGFYKQFKKFTKTPLYIFTESYGGKMTVEFAYELDKLIKKKKLKINFKGVALGDSWISPLDSCLTWGPYLLFVGEVDKNGFNKINRVAEELQEKVYGEEWLNATEKWGDLESVVSEVTYGISFYNILYGDPDEIKILKGMVNKNSYGKGLMNQLNEGGLSELMNTQVKTALKSKIPKSVIWGAQSYDVFDNLREDFMKPVTEYVEKLLNETNLDVVVYSGQLDLIVDTPGTLNWVERLKWYGAQDWKGVLRTQLLANNKEEGFIKSFDKFTFYWINRAGHMVPTDNPYGSIEMLRQVTKYNKISKQSLN